MSWVILIHHIPAKPTALRAKIRRRLHKVGALPIKQATYLLPDTERCVEDLGWIAKEINDQGGEAILLKADLLKGLRNEEIVEKFKEARSKDYDKILEKTRMLIEELQQPGLARDRQQELKFASRKLARSYKAVAAIDFYKGPKQEEALALLTRTESLVYASDASQDEGLGPKNDISGHVWVTRKNVHVDRMASAWFIRRFIDPEASYKFVDNVCYQPQEKEIRFDMDEAEYTHLEDLCTFEVMVKTFMPDQRNLQQVARLVHDIDLKDDLYGLPEVAGIKAVLDYISNLQGSDEMRIAKALTIFDALLSYYQKE